MLAYGAGQPFRYAYVPEDSLWLKVLSTKHIIEVEQPELANFYKMYRGLYAALPLLWPADFWQTTHQTITPKPEIQLRINQDVISADVNFLYTLPDGHVVAADKFHNEQILLVERRERLQRSFDQEDEQISKLTAATTATWDLNRFVMSPDQLSAFVQNVTALGVAVQVPDQGFLKSFSGVSLQVSSGADWFDLQGQVDYGDLNLSIAALLTSIKKGQRWITLSDGSLGLLPEQWLQKHGWLLELGRRDGEQVRLHKSQAAALSGLTGDSDVKVKLDEPSKAFLQKLENFDGIGQATTPKTLQGTLREYQCNGLAWLHFLNDFGFGGILADDMGLGKNDPGAGSATGERQAHSTVFNSRAHISGT